MTEQQSKQAEVAVEGQQAEEVLQAEAPVSKGELTIIREKLTQEENVSAIAERYGIAEEKAKVAIGNVLTVIVNSDDKTNLKKCSANSILTAMKDSATLGLYVDNRKHAELIARYNKDKGVHEAHLQVGYRGFIYKLREQIKGVDIQVFIVEDVEDFSYASRDGVATYDYTPKNPFFDKYTKAAGVFCYIEYEIAGRFRSIIEPLPMSEVEKIRRCAKTQKFWDSWAGEKMKVAAIKRACKVRFAAIVEDLVDFDNEDYDVENVAKAPEGVTSTVSSKLKDALMKERAEATGEATEEPAEDGISDADFEEVEESGENGDDAGGADTVPAEPTPEEQPEEGRPEAEEESVESHQSTDSSSTELMVHENEDESTTLIMEQWDQKTIILDDSSFITVDEANLKQVFASFVEHMARKDVAGRKELMKLNAAMTGWLLDNDHLELYDSLQAMVEE